MKYNNLNRRMFLQGTGSMLAIPFLSSLLPTRAYAANTATKFIHIHSNFGLDRSLTQPLYLDPYPGYVQPTNTNPDSVRWTQKDADTKYQSLAEIIAYQGQISHTFNNSWNSLASKMLLVTNSHAYVSENLHNSGVSGACSNKNDGALGNGDICGPAKEHGYSTDFLIEQVFQAQTNNPISALRVFLADTPGTYNTFCYGGTDGTARRLAMIKSGAELINAIKSAGSGGAQVDQTKITRRQLRIDSVLEDFNNLKNHRRISAVDKKRLDEAAELWYSAEKNMNSGNQAMSCNAPAAAPNGANWTVRQQAAMDAVALALSCGLTRTVAYALLQGGPNMDDQGLMHGWDHDPRGPNSADPKITDRFFAEVTRWRADMVLYFANKLNSMQDENGAPLLDSSLIAWSHQYGGMAHNMFGHSLLSIGGANGKLETGLHVDAGAAPVNRFHLTNMMAAGLSLAQIEKSNVAGFGEVVQPISTGDGSNSRITREQDDKQNDNRKRVYTIDKLAYYQQTAQRRKTHPYLKS